MVYRCHWHCEVLKLCAKGVGYGTGCMDETPTPKKSDVARDTMFFFFGGSLCAHFTGCEKAKEREE